MAAAPALVPATTSPSPYSRVRMFSQKSVPAMSAVSRSGRIEVRFVGSEKIDPNFGQQSVFVSAAVSGVLDR